jgi:pSer/pThr/pTyr-binding forkhead associated (FHA) protein
MPNLTLKFKNTTLEDYQLQKGHSLTIGRRQNNDVIIENLAVSGHHAKIDSVTDGFVLVDLKSKNGSFVNEQLVHSHWLQNGDVINIGKHSLVFSYSEDEVMSDEGSDEMEKTMVIDTNQHRSMMKKSNSIIPKRLTKGRRKEIVGILAYLAGGNGKIKLNGKITKLGKHRSSDIVVKGLFVGQTSGTISKRPDGFYLSYVGGFSKPKLNDKAVKQSAILNDLDIIDIGSTKLQFFIQKSHPKKKKMIQQSV